MFAYLLGIRIVSISSLKARVLGRNSNYLLSIIDAKHGNFYVGLYDKDYNKIREEFMPEKNMQDLIKKYEPLIVTEGDTYNIEEIIAYTKNFERENPHSVNPIYLKLPEAMEKNDKGN